MNTASRRGLFGACIGVMAFVVGFTVADWQAWLLLLGSTTLFEVLVGRMEVALTRREALDVQDREFAAVLRMLVRRATLTDRITAFHTPGHWLNRARKELALAKGEVKA